MYNSDLPIFQDAFQTGEPTANFASQIQTLMVNHPNLGMLGPHWGERIDIKPPATSHWDFPGQVSDAGTTGESGRIAEVWAEAKCWSLHTVERKIKRFALAGWGFATCQATDVLKISENQTWSGFGRCFFTMASLGFSFYFWWVCGESSDDRRQDPMERTILWKTARPHCSSFLLHGAVPPRPCNAELLLLP